MPTTFSTTLSPAAVIKPAARTQRGLSAHRAGDLPPIRCTESEALRLRHDSTTPATVNSTITTDIDVDNVQVPVVAGQIVDFDIDTPATDHRPGRISVVRLQGQELASTTSGRTREST